MELMPMIKSCWRTVAITVGALACSLVMVASPGEPETFQDPKGRKPDETFDLAAFLLRMSFVLEGTVAGIPTDSEHLLPVRVVNVMLGSIPDDTILVTASVTSGRARGALHPGARVLVSGMFTPDRGSRCICHLRLISANGAIISVQEHEVVCGPDPVAVLNGSPLTLPRTFDTLARILRDEQARHPVGWLASGTDIAIAVVSAVDQPTKTLYLGSVESISGAHHSQPRVLQWKFVENCGFFPRPGHRLVIPLLTAAADTLKPDGCIEHLLVQPDETVPALGLRVDRIQESFFIADGRTHLLRVRSPEGEW